MKCCTEFTITAPIYYRAVPVSFGDYSYLKSWYSVKIQSNLSFNPFFRKSTISRINLLFFFFLPRIPLDVTRWKRILKSSWWPSSCSYSLNRLYLGCDGRVVSFVSCPLTVWPLNILLWPKISSTKQPGLYTVYTFYRLIIILNTSIMYFSILCFYV